MLCGHHFQQIVHQTGTVIDPSCGQLNKENRIFQDSPRSRLRFWSRELDPTAPSRVSPLIDSLLAPFAEYIHNRWGCHYRCFSLLFPNEF